MRILKHIINWTVWTLLGLYVAVMISIHIPQVQRWLASETADVLCDKLGTRVNVGRIDLGFFNRIIIDDVSIYDQQGKLMTEAARITAKVELAPLAMGRISISSAQLFGAHFRLSRPSANAPTNFQFVLDSLASKDTTSQSPLNLRINSFIMRHSSIAYDQLDAPATPGKFNPKHLNVNNISAHIILKALTDDSLNVNIKRLACHEQSGIDVRKLALRLEAGTKGAVLSNFLLQLPRSDIHLDSIIATYDSNRLKESLQVRGTIDNTLVAPADFVSFFDKLGNYRHRLSIASDFSYQDSTLNVPHLRIDSDGGDLILHASGHYRRQPYGKPDWNVHVNRMEANSEVFDFVSKNITTLPDPVLRLQDIHLKGDFAGDAEGTLRAQADLVTALGDADVQLQLRQNQQFEGTVSTDGIDVGRLLDNNKIGIIAAKANASGTINREVSVNGEVGRLEYDGDTYRNITLDATYATNQLAGWLQIDDPRVTARLETALKGTNLNNAVGVVSLRGLSLPEQDYHLDYLRIESGFDEGRHFVTLNSDFAHVELEGDFDFATLPYSVSNVIGSRLPTLPGLPPLSKPTGNNFRLEATVAKTDWLQKLLGINLDVRQPLTLKTMVNSRARQFMLDLDAPDLVYGNNSYHNNTIHLTAPEDTLFLQAAINSCQDDGGQLSLKLDGNAADNNLNLTLAWDNNDPKNPLKGVLNTTSRLYRNLDNQAEAHVNILPSDIIIDNSYWQIEPSDVLYSTNRLLVDHFSVHSGDQYIRVDGVASALATDALHAELNDVEVAYILDMVKFDAVEFSGKASGNAIITSAFSNPDAYANLTVNDFKFEKGRMGTLTARVDWNRHDKQIDISATANDGPEATTFINGYVSPERDYIDLGISAHGTYLDFMHSFTESFISHITGHGRGNLRLAGPLSAINLTGGLHVEGEATITPLNTTYQLPGDSITMVYNEILIDSVQLKDRFGNIAYLSGGIHHRDLTNLSLDLHVDTEQFLGYDFTDFGEDSFYGTVFAAGQVDISMKGDDVHIDCNVTPLKNTVFVYNAAQNDAISSQEFITWKSSRNELRGTGYEDTPDGVFSLQGNLEPRNTSTTNIYMTFLVNVTPDPTMRLLMDAKTGDYINLNGTGTLQASYYNKGTFQMQGTYTVESGTYDITIQNIINKKFQFQPGGTIVFGGDPYSAALNLQALYTVNGVSLSDLQIGNSFSSNTVRVNCLMNIGGQPSAPQVTFDLDLPTVNADEKQMVRSLLSSQQEMNQQVLYLLGIGRFYSLGQNNANQQNQQGQTSLAMQSFLSGTLSTQINNVINQIVKNDDWNFGANISTGTEGWNNAEYEGIVAGRMLNNRLLINGQFGYRDNATTATPSFIGDFDVSYMLLPNGNLALKVYNQTNDRYFTRSSLNTQGVGVIMKKDFNGFRDLFRKQKLTIQQENSKNETEEGKNETEEGKKEGN